jgi:hypothetical protein
MKFDESRRNIPVLFILAAALFFVAGCNTLAGPPDSEVMDSRAEALHTPQYDIYFEGEPTMSLLNIEGGYYVWKTGNTWHVRIAKPDRYRIDTAFSPVYKGSVRLERGRIFGVHNHNVDMRNEVHLKQNRIVFNFRLKNNIEGFDFNVQPVGGRYCVTFSLEKDKIFDPSIVHLGRTMFVPDRVPITTCVP